MKQTIIKIIIVAILILYCFFNKFVVVLPFVIILFLFFLHELYTATKKDLTGLIYSERLTLFIVYSTITLIWSPNREEALFQLSILIILVVVSFLLFYFIRKYQYYDLLLYSLLLVSFINHLGALGLTVFDPLMFNSLEKGGSTGVINGWGWGNRFSGVLDNPNSLSIFLIFSLFLSCYVLSKQNHLLKLNRLLEYICFINIPLSLYTIFMTQSRKGMVFGVLLLIAFLLLQFSWRKLLPYFIGVFSAILMIVFLPNLFLIFSDAYGRLDILLNLVQGSGVVDNSSLQRFHLIEIGWEKIRERPIFGHGINSFRYYYEFYAHNNFIELLFGVGIIGFMIYYSIHVSIFRTLLRNSNNNLFLIAFLLILLAMDIGFVSYESKLNMLFFVTISLIISESNGENVKSSNIPDENI